MKNKNLSNEPKFALPAGLLISGLHCASKVVNHGIRYPNLYIYTADNAVAFRKTDGVSTLSYTAKASLVPRPGAMFAITYPDAHILKRKLKELPAKVRKRFPIHCIPTEKTYRFVIGGSGATVHVADRFKEADAGAADVAEVMYKVTQGSHICFTSSRQQMKKLKADLKELLPNISPLVLKKGGREQTLYPINLTTTSGARLFIYTTDDNGKVTYRVDTDIPGDAFMYGDVRLDAKFLVRVLPQLTDSGIIRLYSHPLLFEMSADNGYAYAQMGLRFTRNKDENSK